MEIKIPHECDICVFNDDLVCSIYARTIETDKPDFCKVKTLVDKDELLKEARKGYVELKKVEEILTKAVDGECNCDKCLAEKALNEIKEFGNE